MSATPEPREPASAAFPAGPPAPRGGSRHRAPDDGRRLMWSALAGAGVVVAVAVVAVSCSGGDAGRPGPAGAFATPAETAAVDVTETPVPEEVSPSPTPSPSPSSRPAVRPADLLAGLQATVDQLVRDRQLRRDAGKELSKRLREVSDRLAEGDGAKAREELREFAEKLVNLRNENRIEAGGYETLAALTRQLVQVLPTG